MTPVDRSPARLSGSVAAVAAGVAAIAAGFYSWIALGVGTLGALLLLFGVLRGSRSAVTAGAAGLFVGAVVAGVRGAPAGAVLLGAAATVLAWDVGSFAIGLGKQLGRTATTAELEAVHVAASVGVGTVTIAVGYLVYDNAARGQPLSALILLVLATVALLGAASSGPEDAGDA